MILLHRLYLLVLIVCVDCCACNGEIPENVELHCGDMMKEILKRLDAKDRQIKQLVVKVETLESALETSNQKQSSELNMLREKTEAQSVVLKQIVEQGIIFPKASSVGKTQQYTTADKSKPENQSAAQNIIRARRQNGDPIIAFFATLQPSLFHIGVRQNIKFENVITNVGNSYIPNLGAFICHDPGVYMFSTTLVSYVGHNTHFEFTKNNNGITSLYLRATESVVDTSSQSIVLQLDQGDTVTVRNTDNNESLLGGNYTTFMGVLLDTLPGSHVGVVG